MSRTLYLRLLSPLHIGTNLQMQPFEYVVENGMFYRLAVDRILQRILEHHREAEDRFSKWIEEKTQAIVRQEHDNSRVAQLRREFTLPSFVRTYLRDDTLATAIQRGIADGTFSLYRLPYSSLEGCKREHRHGRWITQQQNKPTISVAIKTADGQLYIPGSSLKGLFRTALLYQVLIEADSAYVTTIAESIRQKLRGFHQQGHRISDKDKKSFDDALESEVFFCGVAAHNRTIWDDGKFDLLKLITISDSTSLQPEEWGEVLPVDVYQANGAIQPQTPAVEAIAAGSVVESRISVDVAFIAAASRWLRTGTAGFGRMQWIRLAEKFHRLFGCTLDNASQERILERLLAAVRAFGRAVAERDRAWASEHDERLAAFYNVLPENACTLGYASGFHGTTVMLAMLANPALAQVEAELLTVFGIGEPPRGKQRQPLEINRFPTTRRMATRWDHTGPTPEPLGWIELSLEPLQPIRGQRPPVAEQMSPPSVVSAEPPLVSSLRNGEVICARVLDNRSKPITVELLARGYEGKHYPCSGVSNIADLVPGTIIRVRVNLHPKTRHVQSLTFMGRWNG